MSQLGIFCVVARTELLEKEPTTTDTTLYYLNHTIKQAFILGLGRAAEIATNRHAYNIALEIENEQKLLRPVETTNELPTL